MEEILKSPYVDMAKKALTPEQLEEYKRIGNYMYETDVYQKAEFGEKLKEAKVEDFASYATEGLKSGLNPMELSQKEVKALIDQYGKEWYTHFGYTKEEVPEYTITAYKGQDISELNLSRQQRRWLERKVEKVKRKEKNQRK